MATNRDARYGDSENNVDGKRHAQTSLEWIDTVFAHANDASSHDAENCSRCSTSKGEWTQYKCASRAAEKRCAIDECKLGGADCWFKHSAKLKQQKHIHCNVEQSKVHKACRDQSVPLAIVKKHSRQRHVVLKSTDSGDLAPHEQSKIDCDDGIADNKRVVVWLVAIALYWLACDCLWRWRRWWRRTLRR